MTLKKKHSRQLSLAAQITVELGKCSDTADCGTKDSTANAGPEHLSSARSEEQSGAYFGFLSPLQQGQKVVR